MRHFFLLSILLFSCIVFAQNSAKVIKHYNLESGLAIKGYDPVAYFLEKKAEKGNSQIRALYQGAIYQFSSTSHKNLFLENPPKYEPQYGGWCAYAMGANGEKVDIDPETFKVIDGKLYLFYNAYFNNTLKKWNKDERGLKAKADINWINLLKL